MLAPSLDLAPWRPGGFLAPLLALLLLAGAAQAEWTGAPRFQAPMEVSPARPGVFHHLDASGRKSLAVGASHVALAWEDNRGGAPGCHVAIKPVAIKPVATKAADQAGFTEYAFGQGECFEPGIAALDGARFLLIWEDAAGVAAAVAGPTGVGAPLRLAPQGGHGAILGDAKFGIQAAWSAPEGRWRRIWRSRLSLDGERLTAAPAQPADPAPAADDQLYPVLAATPSTLVLAWEDRRHGHTVVYYSHSGDGQAWSPPARLSQNPTGRAQGTNLGRGTGAMRPTLAAFGERMAAVWLDKRDFLSGYDVYAAVSRDGGARFAANAKAQDSFGDAIAQWHAAAAGNANGDLVIAWDDDRDGTADIWLTWPKLDGQGGRAGYADNSAAVAGPAHQSDPAIALDAAGRLHLAWIERGEGGVTRLMYAVTGDR